VRIDPLFQANAPARAAGAVVDGNVAAGMLSEMFVEDVTTARVTCANCGAARPLGALLVYVHGMGMVMRCTTCDSVVMRMARTPTRLWFDPTGARFLTMAAPPTAVV
jgi:hypothetical protein